MGRTRLVAVAAALTSAGACTRSDESVARSGGTTTIGRSTTIEQTTTTSTITTTLSTTTTLPTTSTPATTVPPTTAPPIVVTQVCDIHAPYNHPVNQNCWMTEQEFVDARVAEIAANLPEIMESPVDVESPTFP